MELDNFDSAAVRLERNTNFRTNQKEIQTLEPSAAAE